MLSNLKSKVLTVNGALDPSELGITLIHEHLLCDISCYYDPPQDPKGKELANQPLKLSTLGWVRQHHMSCLSNLRIDEEDVAMAEVAEFLRLGGKSIVDATSVGLARNPRALLRIADRTGVNVVMGSGYYIHRAHPTDMDQRTVDALTREILSDIISGIDCTEVHAGIIGEIGTSSPLHPNEEKCLRAAARAHKETGAPISIHPGQGQDSAMQSVRILREEGVDPHRIVMSHIENRYREQIDLYRALADTGCNLGFDTFGRDAYFEALGRQHPSDELRIEIISQLIRLGYCRQIMLAQDCCYRSDLTKYGGHGYAHILENILPRFQRIGLSEADIHRMLVDNPQGFLPFSTS
jgi:phosphotriesterase-related protein